MEFARERTASGVMMIPVPKSGILEAVSGEEAARLVPDVTELMITARCTMPLPHGRKVQAIWGFFSRAQTRRKKSSGAPQCP